MAMIKKKGQLICGGTLVGSNAIVTAAHCVFDMERRDELSVWLGAYNINDGVQYKIKEVRYFEIMQKQFLQK